MKKLYKKIYCDKLCKVMLHYYIWNDNSVHCFMKPGCLVDWGEIHKGYKEKTM